MDTLPGTQFTDMWMSNPWMFDPSQQSNQFSNYNNAPLPYPPTYNTGFAGGPVNAATGQPIQSFLDWMKANPGGTTLNSTPAAPAPSPDLAKLLQRNMAAAAGQGTQGMGVSPYGYFSQAGGAQGVSGGGRGVPQAGAVWTPTPVPSPAAGTQGATGGAAQGGAAPNNWQAALNALANPGKVTTPGAQIPAGGAAQGWGFQPAGGVNDAFLAARGYGPGGTPQGGLNQNFMSALAAIQGRPQGGGATGGGAAAGGGGGGLANAPFTNYGNMGGASMGSLGGNPPPGTPGADPNAATAQYTQWMQQNPGAGWGAMLNATGGSGPGSPAQMGAMANLLRNQMGR